MAASRTIVARFKAGFQHENQEDLERYLKKHPKADPAKHTVKNPKKPSGEDKGKPEMGTKPEAPAKGQDQAPQEPKKPLLKRLSEGARAFLSTTSKETQRFVSDPKHRQQILKGAGKAILKSPQTYAKRVLHTVKHELHEFKEAGEAIAHLAKGGKIDAHQKKVLKTVAIHMGVAIAAAALSSTGVLAGAAALGKGMAQKVALKAAMKSLEHVHLLQEVHHIGHGLMHLAGEDKKGPKDPEEAFALLVAQSVAKELQAFSDEDMGEVLTKAAEGASKSSVKTAASKASEFPALIAKAETALDGVSDTLKGFQRMLIAAKADSQTLGGSRVWQDRPVVFFKAVEASIEELQEVDEALDNVSLDVVALSSLANEARNILFVPRKATVEQAISDIDFAQNPNTGREGISYSVDALKGWADELGKWVVATKRHLKSIEQKAARIVRTKGLV